MKLPRLIGVIRLSPLGGAPRAPNTHPAELLQTAGVAAVREALLLARAGFDGVLLENFGDSPYYTHQVPPETVASMAIVAAAVRESVTIQVGVHILKNASQASLAIAAVTGCDFIRIGFSATSSPEPAFILRERERLGAPLTLLADLADEYTESLSLGAVEGRILSGTKTSFSDLQIVSGIARENRVPLYLSDGVPLDKLYQMYPWVDGMIVSSAIRKSDGSTLDLKAAREFAQTFAQLGRKKGRTNGKGKKSSRKVST